MSDDRRDPDVSLRAYRALYRAMPVKKGMNFLSLKLKTWFVPPGDVPVLVSARLAGGRFAIELDLRDRIQYMMWVRGRHEAELEALIERELAPGGGFVDVGANIGYFSLLAASLDPSNRVFAFEPLPKNMAALRASAELNRFSNIRFRELAISRRAGETDLIADDPVRESGWNRIGLPPGANSGGGTRIPVRVETLDHSLVSQDARRVDIIKIDVEGHELAVLEGAEATLTSPGRRMVLIELNEICLRAQGVTAADLDAHLTSRGYRLHRVRRNGTLVPATVAEVAGRDMNCCYLKPS